VRQLGDALSLTGNARLFFESAAHGQADLDSFIPLGFPPTSKAESSLRVRGKRQKHLDSSLERTAAGLGGVLTVRGAHGSGKGRLALELAHKALARGFDVGWGTAYLAEKHMPLAPLAEAVRGLVDEGPENLPSRLERWPRLVQLLGYESGASHISGPYFETLTAAVNQITLALSQLSNQRPIVLILDDVHASDDASLGALHHLSLTVPRLAILLVMMYEPGTTSVEMCFSHLTSTAHTPSSNRAIQLASPSQLEKSQVAEKVLVAP
jgi:predicted ATPase